jgi:hypothetical protein
MLASLTRQATALLGCVSHLGPTDIGVTPSRSLSAGRCSVCRRIVFSKWTKSVYRAYVRAGGLQRLIVTSCGDEVTASELNPLVEFYPDESLYAET